jgi:dipeptidyl aminopeptidase/acylaminoacyl peptidase
MERTRRRLLIPAFLLAGLLPAQPRTARAAPPIEAYGRLPGVELVRLSPSGERVALIGVVGEQRRLFIMNADNKVLKTGLIGDSKVRDLNWAGDDHLLVTTSATMNLQLDFGHKYELASVIHVGMDDKAPWAVFSRCNGIEPTVRGYFGAAQQGGKWYGFFGGITEARDLAGGYVFDHGYADLYRVDLGTGKTVLVANGSEREHEWAIGEDGTVIAHSEYTGAAGDWRMFAGPHSVNNNPVIHKLSPTNDIDLVGAGRSPGTALVLNRSGEADIAEEINLSDGKAQELFADNRVRDYRYDPLSHLLIGVSTVEEPGELFLDHLSQARFVGARKAFPGLQVHLESYSPALKRMIVETEGGGDSGTFWLVDIATGNAVPLGYAYPAIRPADVGATSLVKYQAADGLALEGILTLPPGREPKSLPLVVMPHGGPMGVSDEIGFDWWAQAFASRGYAVFQPNYRGSGGVSTDLRHAGYGQWGKKMLSDISDGVAEIARQHIVEPTRVCIVGASYGGYAALAGVTLQQGLYRCAVSVAGPSNLLSFGAWQSSFYGYTSDSIRYWRKLTGEDTGGEPLLRAISPALLADKADAPILLIHGKDDTRVPIEQSEQMAAALKRAGKFHEFTVLPHEDHFLSRETTRLAMLTAAVNFVQKYDPAY